MSSYRESATPIYDEVDRRWRRTEVPDDADSDTDGDTGTTPSSMLSFPGTPATEPATEPAAPAGRRAHAAPAADGSSPTVLSLITAAREESGPRHALRR